MAYRDKNQGIAFVYFPQRSFMVRHKDDVKTAIMSESANETMSLNKVKNNVERLKQLHLKLDNMLKRLDKLKAGRK